MRMFMYIVGAVLVGAIILGTAYKLDQFNTALTKSMIKSLNIQD